jgi:hypothetical protein
MRNDAGLSIGSDDGEKEEQTWRCSRREMLSE